MHAEPRPSQFSQPTQRSDPLDASQPFPHAEDGRRFEVVEPFAPIDDMVGAADLPVTFYVTRSALASLQREAQAARSAGGASGLDWRTHAQRKLDAALARQALPLTLEQAEALRQYAATLDMEPQELLLTLLAPGIVRRERVLRQSVAFVRAHSPRRPSGCLLLAVWFSALVGFWNLAAWTLSFAPLLLHR